MLLTAAVVPGPPAFVVELMGSAAHELDDLRAATDRLLSRALDDLLAVSAGWPPLPVDRDSVPISPTSSSSSTSSSTSWPLPASRWDPAQLVIVGPGQPRELNAAGPVSFASFGRDVVLPALVEGQQCDPDLPTPIMVARYLASRDIVAHPEHAELWAAARWITTSGGHARALGERLGAQGTRVGLILVADGAACHGPKAPRAQDARAKAYDDGVCAALASGKPARLAQIDAALGDELGATGFHVWPVLVAAAAEAAAAEAADGADGAVAVEATDGAAAEAKGGAAAEAKGGAEAAEGVGAAGAADVAGAADAAGATDAAENAQSERIGEVVWAGAPYGVGWVVASWRRDATDTVSEQA